MHSADAVLVAAADAVTNATMKLMGEEESRGVVADSRLAPDS